MRLRRGPIGVDWKLHSGTFALDATALLLFSPPDLVDDEGREHPSDLAFLSLARP
jgi:hypothetical protein